MIELLVVVSLLLGAVLMLLAAVGIFRLPDLPTRMHAATKSGALGIMFIMLAVALHFAEGFVVTRAIAIVLFTLITAPISAHVIGRAAYFVGVPLWSGTIKDELKESYDPTTHTLCSDLDDPDPKG